MSWASPFSQISWFTYTIRSFVDVDTERILNTGFIGTALFLIIRYFATSSKLICTME